jgi:type II secretory pathway component PulL
LKRQRVPYARNSVWVAVAILAAAVVVGVIVGGLEIHHLNNQVTSLQKQVTALYVQSLQSGSHGK